MGGTAGSVPSILARLPPAQTKHLVLENSARDRSIVTIRLSKPILDVIAKYLFIEFTVMAACACIVSACHFRQDMSCIRKCWFLLPLEVIMKSQKC